MCVKPSAPSELEEAAGYAQAFTAIASLLSLGQVAPSPSPARRRVAMKTDTNMTAALCQLRHEGRASVAR